MHGKNSDMRPMGTIEAAKAADRLFGFYPRSAASDPEIFMTGLVELFASYPAYLTERFLSVTTGIPGRFKMLPSIAEIRQFCEDIYGPLRRAQEWQELQKQRMEWARNNPALPAPELPPRPTLEELKAKYGENWGLKSPALEKPQPLTLDALAAKYGVPKEIVHAIPDAKPIPKNFKGAA